MASLKDLRDRISSVQSTKKITSAMKLVAGARLKKAQTEAESSRPYTNRMQEIIGNVTSSIKNINNAVYKAGFASSKEAYEDAYENLFKALDKLEQILESRKYLLGEEITETDWRVFPTLIRFDAIYYSQFKCNKKRIIDYPNLHRLIKDLYNFKSVKETVDTDQSKIHYFGSHKLLNPSGIIPKGPKSLF